MSILTDLVTDNSIEEEKDTLGGGRNILPSGVYPMTIKEAYFDVKESEAVFLHLDFEDGSGGYVSANWCVRSGAKKGKRNFWIDQDGVKHYLPDFNKANALAQLATGKQLAEQDVENLTIQIYDFVTKAKKPQKRDVLMSLRGKKVLLGVHHVIDNKQKKVGNDYVDTNDKKEFNDIHKVFCAHEKHEGKTLSELKDKKCEKADFIHRWKEKYNDQIQDLFTPVAGAPTSGMPTGTGAPGNEAESTDSLFGDI